MRARPCYAGAMSTPGEPAPPRPIEPVASTGPVPMGPWLAAHAIGLATLVLGVVGFLVTSLTQEKFWATPSWKLTVPFVVLTVVGAVLSIARRERTLALPLLGVGLAAAAMVLGWFLIMGIVIVATALVILVLSAVM